MDQIWWNVRDIEPTLGAFLLRDSKRDFCILSTVYGLPIVCSIAQAMSLGWGMPAGLLVLLALLFAMPVGVVLIYAASWVLYWIGKRLKGKATQREVRWAIAWANLPMAVVGAIWIIESLVFGGRLFQISFFQQNFTMLQQSILMVLSAVQLGINIWVFFQVIKSLAFVQRYSVQKALINLVVPYLVFIVWVVLIR